MVGWGPKMKLATIIADGGCVFCVLKVLLSKEVFVSSPVAAYFAIFLMSSAPDPTDCRLPLLCFRSLPFERAGKVFQPRLQLSFSGGCVAPYGPSSPFSPFHDWFRSFGEPNKPSESLSRRICGLQLVAHVKFQ